MNTYHIYYANSVHNEMPDPVIIEAYDKDSAIEIFESTYPKYIISRIVEELNFEDLDDDLMFI